MLKLMNSTTRIRQLHGMARLYSVTRLDVSENKLRTLADVTTVTALPCIEHLTLSPNKVNNEVDYRYAEAEYIFTLPINIFPSDSRCWRGTGAAAARSLWTTRRRLRRRWTKSVCSWLSGKQILQLLQKLVV